MQVTCMDKKIILYIAMSLDGFIAKEDGNLDWLTKYDNNKEDYGFKELYDRIGTVLVGSTTYFQVEDVYEGKDVYVFSRKSLKNKPYNVHFVKGNVEDVVNNLELGDNRNIWLVGGADLANQLLRADLIDEYVITIIPILLGSGIPLFRGKNPESDLMLLNVKHFNSGLVQLHYIRS